VPTLATLAAERETKEAMRHSQIQPGIGFNAHKLRSGPKGPTAKAMPWRRVKGGHCRGYAKEGEKRQASPRLFQGSTYEGETFNETRCGLCGGMWQPHRGAAAHPHVP